MKDIQANAHLLVKTGLFPLLLVSFAVGCASPAGRKVISSFRGNYLGEQKVHEKVDAAPPTMKEIDWDSDQGNLRVHVQQQQKVAYDLLKKYEKVDIVREISAADAKTAAHSKNKYIVSMTIGSILTVGIGVVVAAVDAGTEAKNISEIRGKAIQAIRSGQREVLVPASKNGTYPAARYFREANGEEVDILKGLEDSRVVDIAKIPMKLAWLGAQPELTGVSDDSGWATFKFADNPFVDQLLKPADLRILAQWQGNWIEVGTTKLDEQKIAQVRERIAQERMAARGIPSLPPLGQVTVRTAEGEIRSDSDCEITLAIKNAGKGEFYCLTAASESVVASLDGVKFEFGKLIPGTTRTITKKVRIPKDQPTGPVVMTFKWSELNGYQPDPVQARIMVRGLSRPKFAMTVQVVDDNSGNSVGNGDGRIQKGEAVDLLVTAKNIGDGTAKDVIVVLDGVSGDGVVLNTGEAKIGEIAPNESKQARLTITTKKSANIDKLTPTVHVIDQYLQVKHDEPLVLALDSELPLSIMTYKSSVYVGKEDTAIRSGAGTDTSIIGRAKPGTALQATGELGQWVRVEMPGNKVGWVQRATVSFERTSVPVETATSGVVEILQKAPPLIVIAKPLNNTKVSSSKIDVSGVIASSMGIQRAEFIVNGQKTQTSGQRGISVQGVGSAREQSFAFSVDLAEGENKIEIVAWDIDGLEARKAHSITYEKAKGSVHVVCIGIDAYQSVPRLKYAAADAKEMAACLQRRLAVPEKNVHLVLNEDATLQKIRDVLGVKVRQNAGPADTVIIYFSGHGAPEADPHSADQDGVAKYLLPVGADSTSLFSTALPMDEVRTIFRRIVSERVIFLADTCYSGAAGGRTLMPTATAFRSINSNNLLARLRDTGTGRVIMTASRGSEVSQEKDDMGHGVFTYYLLKGLQGEADKNNDGIVSVGELYEYVSAQVPKATKNTQTPLMSADEIAGEIVLGVTK